MANIGGFHGTSNQNLLSLSLSLTLSSSCTRGIPSGIRLSPRVARRPLLASRFRSTGPPCINPNGECQYRGFARVTATTNRLRYVAGVSVRTKVSYAFDARYERFYFFLLLFFFFSRGRLIVFEDYSWTGVVQFFGIGGRVLFSSRIARFSWLGCNLDAYIYICKYLIIFINETN